MDGNWHEGFKKGLALGLSGNIFSVGLRGNRPSAPPVIASGTDWYKGSAKIYSIYRVTFSDYEAPDTYDEMWDASADGSGDVRGYIFDYDEHGNKEIALVGNGAGTIKAVGSFKFTDFSNLRYVVNFRILDTSEVTDMSYMFSYVPLYEIDMSNFDTSNATDMSYMFYESLRVGAKGVDLGNFDTRKVTNMSYMFYYICYWSRGKGPNLSSFDTSNVTDMSYMFYKCMCGGYLDVRNFDTRNVKNMACMFYGCTQSYIDVSNFDTRNVTSMASMFSSASITCLDVSSFDTSNVTTMFNMFGDSSIISVDVSSFDTSNVTNMEYMFDNCKELTSLDLSNFDTSNVTNMGSMFKKCSDLEAVYVGPGWVEAADNTDMFTECGVSSVTHK